MTFNKKQFLDSNEIGFSLIELMIAVAIFGIVSVIAIPSYRQWMENSRIRNAAESIQNGLQKARAQAVLYNTSVKFVLGSNSAWTVSCATTTTTAPCDATIEDHKAKDGAGTTTSITPNPATANTLTFTNLGARDISKVSSELNYVNIDSSSLAAADSRDLRVKIGTGGNVRMCDPNLPSTDFRAC